MNQAKTGPFDEIATEDYGAIGRFLRSPTEAVDVELFSARFQAIRIKLRLAGLAQAATDPALVGRLRGAFGHVLMRTASPQALSGRPCPWDPPCLYEALFRKQGRMTPGTDFPSPWVLAAQPRRDSLEIMLTMFGVATEWVPAAAEALVEACSKVDWRSSRSGYVPHLDILDRRMTKVVIKAASPRRELELEFMTPLVVSSQAPEHDPLVAFKTFGLRLEGLARWHGLTLSCVNWSEVSAFWSNASSGWLEAEAIKWQRGSRRQDRHIPMKGLIGRLIVSGDRAVMNKLMPLIHFGAITHVGADVAFGCGRYRIVEF